MKERLIILLTFVLFIGGCKKDESNPVENELNTNQVLIPLTVGNHWKYFRTFYDSSGIILNQDSISCTVEKDTTFNNEKWYQTSWGFLKNKTDGVYQYFSSSSNVQGIEYSTLQWVYPSSENYNYKPLGANGTIKLMSINESYTTPTKTFQCYHFRITYDNSNGYQQDYYFCPGVGYVKWEDGIQSSSGKYHHCNRYELISCEIAEK